MGEGGGTKYKWMKRKRFSIRVKVDLYEVCAYSILFMLFFIIL